MKNYHPSKGKTNQLPVLVFTFLMMGFLVTNSRELFAFNNHLPENESTPIEIEEPLVPECQSTNSCGSGGGPSVPIPSVCGNGIREGNEQCDQKNQMDELGQCSTDHSMYCNNSCRCEVVREDVMDKLPSAQVADVVNQFEMNHPEVEVEDEGSFFVVRYPAESVVSLRSSLQSELNQITECAGGRCQMVDAILPFAALPNDPKLNEQWNLCKVNAPGGWNMSLGSGSVTIAHIDTGVNFDHEDLQGLLGSGRITGYTRCSTPDCSLQEGVFDSYYYHGTNTFGVMSASWDNNAGIAGIVPQNVKFYVANISGRYDTNLPGTENERAAQTKLSYVLQAIDRSTQAGAKVVLAGIGIPGTLTDAQLQVFTDPNRLRDALLVLPAGNNGLLRDRPLFFNHPQVLIAGSTDESDLKVNTSNYGANWVHLGAPGIHVPTTKDLTYDPNLNLYPQNPIESGTSIAAAEVAGTLGLLYSINPALTAQNAKSLLLSGVDPYPIAQTFALGAGRLNMKRAMCKTQTNDPEAECPALTVNASADPNSADVDEPISFSCSVEEANLPCNAANFFYSWNFGDGSSSTEQNPTYSYQTAGNYTAMCTASDQDIPQNQGSGSVQLTITGPSSGNQPPYVYAGPDQTIALPAAAYLMETKSDDGLPNGMLFSSWSKQSGPGNVTFEFMPNTFPGTTRATFSAPGVYVLRVTASDTELQSFDELTVTVNGSQLGPACYGGVTVKHVEKPVTSEPNARTLNDNFGYSMSIDGNQMAIGAPLQSFDTTGTNYVAGAGAVLIYENVSGNWVLKQKVAAPDRMLNYNDGSGPCYQWQNADRFGQSVAISGSTMIVGAPWHDYGVNGEPSTCDKPDRGAIYIFKKIGGVWTFQQKFVGVQPGISTMYGSPPLFGYSVAISGSTIVVGEGGVQQHTDGTFYTGAGAISIFTESSGVWSLRKKIKGTDLSANPNDALYSGFGGAVAISSNTIVSGAPGYTSSNGWSVGPAAFVFVGSGSNWPLQQTLTSTENAWYPAASSRFGHSVSISGDRIIVGAPTENMNTPFHVINGGRAHVFKRVNNVWSLQQIFSGTGSYNTFGSAVSIAGDFLTIGSNTTDFCAASPLSGYGAAHIYKYTNTDPNLPWSLNAVVAGSLPGRTLQNGGPSGMFGKSAIIAATGAFVVGSYDEDYDAQGNNPMFNAGAIWTGQITSGASPSGTGGGPKGGNGVVWEVTPGGNDGNPFCPDPNNPSHIIPCPDRY